MSASQPASSKGRGYFDSFGKSAEAEFMPETAGASLQDSPRWSRITVWLAAALLISALVWAKFAVLQEVTMGEGKAIPSSKVQVIQNLEGGIVTEIFVREGQMVSKGDTLLRLDDTRYLSNKGESEADRYALTAQVERLSAEAEGRPFKLSDEVIAKAPQVAEDERALYDQRQRRLASEQRTLTEQLRQKTQELAEFRSKQGQFSSSLALVNQEMGMSAPLVKTGAVSPVEILRLKRSAVEIRGSLNATPWRFPGRNRRLPRSGARFRRISNRPSVRKLRKS
jgi:adhesin transport system membrane fusion protein